MLYKTCKEIEVAVARHFGVRSHIIVPNVSWGLLPWEVDLAVMSASGYLYEIEIKISKGDLIKDKDKQKWKWRSYGHYDMIKRMWFAMPESMLPHIEHVPVKAGILLVNESGHVKEVRRTTINVSARKLTEKEQYTLARLGTMRIWSLKETILEKNAIIRKEREKNANTV